MFKIGLLTSTAMTAVTLLLTDAPAAVQTDMHIASRDPNARFLCTYGHFNVMVNESGGGSYSSSSWAHVAVPITGHGETVRRIKVIESPVGSDASVTAGIYSNAPSGFPGNAIAVGSGKMVSRGCAPVTIEIAKTTLKRNKKYWIEESTRCQFPLRTPPRADNNRKRRRHAPAFCSWSHSGPSYVDWIVDPDTKRKAYVQKHRYSWFLSGSTSFSSTTPWMKQTKGPYLRLK